jgi:hypothetical protein
VQNPAAPWIEPAPPPYPPQVENLKSHIDSRYLATYSSLLLLIPLFTCLFSDFFDNGSLSWSLYVGGALGLLFIFVLFPYMFRKRNIVFLLLIDSIATTLYLLLVETVHHGKWFLHLGLPLSLSAGFFIVVPAIIFTYNKKMGGLVRTALIFFFTGMFVVSIELTLNQYITSSPYPLHWSVYPLIPCLILGVLILLLNQRIRLKDEFRRRFFL